MATRGLLPSRSTAQADPASSSSTAPSPSQPSWKARLAHRLRRLRLRPAAPPAWALYLAGGCLVSLVVLILRSGRLWNILWEVIPISALAAIAVGIRRFRPAGAAAWWLIFTGTAFFLAADLGWTVWYAVTGEDPPSPSVLDVVYLMTYPGLILGMSRLPGRVRRDDAHATLDAFVVTAGMGLLSWSLMIDPLLDDQELKGLELLVAVAYPVCDLLVVFFATRLILLHGRTSLSRVLLTMSCAALLVADTLMVLDLAEGEGSAGGTLANAGWLGWAVLIGTAALHPSMARGEPDSRPAGGLGSARIGLFLVLLTVAPVPFLFNVKSGQVGGPGDDWFEVVVPFGLIVVIVVPILIRLAMITNLAERRALHLDRQAESLADALREEEALKRRLTHRALHDPLTGLANRALFQDRFDQALARRAADGAPALLFLNIDGFKDVNDTYGHPVGDELLVGFSHRLRKVLREADTIARLGADEFAALIEEITLAEAEDVGARVMEAIREPFELGDRRVAVTASAGLLMVEPGSTAADALRDADLALHAAKTGGKDRVSVFQPDLRDARLDHVRMAGALREALDRSEFTLHYQPVVALADGRIQGAEALLRWHRPNGENISPAEFIPLAEETGLIVGIGTWVLRQACTDARRWWRRYGGYVTVNISALQLQRPDFVQTVLGVLGDTGLPPESLVLELTETVLLATSKAETRTLTGRLEELRRRGVRIALDDFGTGYSSLAYLRYLPIDLVKIDQSFMQSDDDVARQGQAFTRAILDLCRILRVRAVAEGVETPAQHDFLRTLGCPLGQGYLYGAPMPREDFERLLSWRPAAAVAIEAGAGSGSGVSATPVAGASAGNSVVAATATSSVALSPHVSSSSSLSSSSAVAPGAAATPGGERDHPG